MDYTKASIDWFANSIFGIATHWTAMSVPASGKPHRFDEAVAQFDVTQFLDAVGGTGARYLLFTSTHALQMLPAPCATLDRLLPGRTSSRDLLGELADGCMARGMRFLIYYNHSCNSGEDKPWERAVGYHLPEKTTLARNICSIVRELAGRYGRSLAGWWFDSCYAVDPSGPENTCTTDMRGFRFPWEELTAAAKAGSPDCLVSYNPGAWPPHWQYLYTTHQDYLAGEANDLIEVPTSRWSYGGLQNHRWICIDNPHWVHAQLDTPLWPARYSGGDLAAYLRCARRAQTPVTFNVDVDQPGHLSPTSLQVLRQAAEQSC